MGELMSDATLAWLLVTGVLLLAGDLVLLHYHRRAARSRRPPVVLFGTDRSDE